MEPSFGDEHRCKVCLGSGRAKQCWGCSFWWHPRCLGMESTHPGPLYCGTCRNWARSECKEDYTYDEDLMQLVTTSVMPQGLSPTTQGRITKQSRWLRWERGKLYITTGDIREIVPPRLRRKLVEKVSASLGYLGGERLHALLKHRYHWPTMRLDCVKWCVQQLPSFLEHTTWRPPQHLQPSNKATAPFHTWCVDLVTGLDPGPNGKTILVVGVCAFSKWVEAAPL
jgi:hypothetical protein